MFMKRTVLCERLRAYTQGVEGTVVGDALSRWFDSMGFSRHARRDGQAPEELRSGSDRSAHPLPLDTRFVHSMCHCLLLVVLYR